MINDDPNQPKEFEAVLGGENPPPIDGLVLGGIEGVKNRLTSSNVKVQIAALTEAMNCGEPGLNLVIDTLQRSPAKVQRLIARLLRERGGIEGKQFLLDYNPRLFFTALEDWDKDELYSQYVASKSMGFLHTVDTTQQLQDLLKNPKSKNLPALECDIANCEEDSLGFLYCVNAIVKAHQKLPNLRALFIGDMKSEDSEQWVDGCSPYFIGNINPILKTFPDLELLHLCGCLNRPFQVTKPLLENLQFPEQKILKLSKCDSYSVVAEKPQQAHLKTLIIEGSELRNEHITQLCQLEYPSLEYLELWLGKNDTDGIVESLAPILSGECCPNLLYLGLIGTNYTNAIARAIARSKIISRLKILDLKAGRLSSEGVTSLLNCPPVNNLYALNVSENQIEQKLIKKLSQLKCQVIADLQFHDRYNPTYE